jgi:hypothetical protein
MGIIEFAKKAKAINLRDVATQAARNKSDYLVEINRLQLRTGEDAEGQPLDFYRSLGYALYKASLPTFKSEVGIPDLFLTGAFQNAMKVNVSSGQFDITSSDKKTRKLQDRYGEIFGINPAKLPLVRAKMDREFARIFKLKVGL